MANEVHSSKLAISNLVSNKGKWNNCLIKFSTFGFAKFYLRLRNDWKVMWLPGAKNFMLSNIRRIHFHIM